MFRYHPRTYEYCSAVSHARAWHVSLGIRVPHQKHQTTRFLPTLHPHYIFNIFSILVISCIQYNMSRNRVFDDANHVNDEHTITKLLKQFFFKFWFLFQFESFSIKNDLQHDFDKLFQHVSRTSYDIFSLFFIEKIFQKLINYINQYEKIHEIDEKNKSYARIWFFIIVKKLRAYIVIWIYMNLHFETCIENYWNANRTKFIHEFVSKHIFLKR